MHTTVVTTLIVVIEIESGCNAERETVMGAVLRRVIAQRFQCLGPRTATVGIKSRRIVS
jgi:hypothetical protein